MNDVRVMVNNFQEFIDSLESELKIDSYQRPYVWGADKTKELIDDLEMYLDNTRDLSYYMGTILLHQKSEDDTINYYIIDGQQRLTTLMVLYFTLFNQLPDNVALSYNSPVSVKYIQTTKRLFEEHKNKFKKHLKDLFKNLSFTFVITTSEDLAFTFFDTQNNRGVRLGTTDLLKAYHLRAIEGIKKKENQELSAKHWEQIQEQKNILPSNRDFVLQLYEKFIWRGRSWQGQKLILKESDEKILEEFQINVLKSKNNGIHLYAHPSNQKYDMLQLEDSNLILHPTNQIYNQDDKELPFTLRQPINSGLGFFLYTQKYAQILEYIFQDKEVNSEIREFRAFYKNVYTHMSIYLKELFVLSILLYYDKFRSSKLLMFALWLDYHLGAIRLDKEYIFEQAPLKFLRESSMNLLDVISYAFREDAVIDYLKQEAKKIIVYGTEKVQPTEGVQGRYKASVLDYFGIHYDKKDGKVNHLQNKKSWITKKIALKKESNG